VCAVATLDAPADDPKIGDLVTDNGKSIDSSAPFARETERFAGIARKPNDSITPGKSAIG